METSFLFFYYKLYIIVCLANREEIGTVSFSVGAAFLLLAMAFNFKRPPCHPQQQIDHGMETTWN
jgi:hypothetical protein